MRHIITPFIFLLLLLAIKPASGQQYFRIRADVTVKTKLSNGEQSLTVGKVYYDRNERKIVYELSFPESEFIVTVDTITYRIRDGKIVHRFFSPSLVDFSVFHLALSSNLPDYGLRKTQFVVEEVVSENNLVITTWKPPVELEEDLGKMMISVKEKQLHGVIFFTPEGQISRKQLFEEYILQDGIAFPGQIVEISYDQSGESYQIMTFKNLVIDELENNKLYNYNLSDF